MPDTVSVVRGNLRPLILVGAVIAVLLAVAAVLWSYYGTAVFFEIVRNGWIACFG